MFLKIALFSKEGGTLVSQPPDLVLLGKTGRCAKEKTDHFVPVQARNKQRICGKMTHKQLQLQTILKHQLRII